MRHYSFILLFFLVLFLATTAQSREVSLAAPEAYHLICNQVDTLIARSHLLEKEVSRILQYLEVRRNEKVEGISTERWNNLVTYQSDRILKHYITGLMDNGDWDRANTWLSRMQAENNDPIRLVLQARSDAASGDTLAALSEALTALFYSRSPEAEAVAVKCYSTSKNTIPYPDYRDDFLQNQARFHLSEQQTRSGRLPEVDKYCLARLFPVGVQSLAGVVALWDEYLTEDDQIFLSEVYQASRAKGLGFMLCYAGSNFDQARLHLPTGVPVAGIDLAREAKSARKLQMSGFPAVLLVTPTGQTVYLSEDKNRAIPYLLPLLLRNIAINKDAP